jgi:uncharacterized protein YraI
MTCPPSAVAEDPAKGGDAAGRLLCVHGVSGSSLNVRAGPGLDRPVVATLRRDDCGLAQVGRCDAGWCEMARGDVRGWVDTRYVGVYEAPDARHAKTERAPAQRAIVRKRTKRKVLSASARTASSSRMVSADTVRSPIFDRSYGPIGGLFRMALGAAFTAVPRSGIAAGSCVVGVAPWDTLRVRSGPGIAHAPIGAIPSDACHVRQLSDCRGQWCRVAWRGHVGWVNTFYLR